MSEQELRQNGHTLTRFIFEKYDKGELVIDGNLVDEAVIYYRANTKSKSKRKKKPSQIKRQLRKDLLFFNSILTKK